MEAKTPRGDAAPLGRYHKRAKRLGIEIEEPESEAEALDRTAKRRRPNR